MKRFLAVLLLMFGSTLLMWGQGVPYGTTVVASASWTAQTDGIASTSLYTPSADGNYRVSVWMETSNYINNCPLIEHAHISWTSDYGSYTYPNSGYGPLQLYPLAYTYGSIVVRAKAGSAISFLVSLGDNCSPGPPTQPYNVYVVVEKL